MNVERGRDHWFSFRDSCVSVVESASSSLNSNGAIDGRPIFFLHGRFGQAETWNPLIEGLIEQFRCFSLDFPGFGRSFSVRNRPFSLLEYVSLVNELIHQLSKSDEQVILVGHDVGGGIAQLCALKSPEKIGALVLMNSACITHSLVKVDFGFQGYLARWQLRRLLDSSISMSPDFKETLFVPWSNRVSRNALLRSFKALDDSWPWHYEKQVWKDAIKKIFQPVLLLWGKNDPFNPLELAVDLMQKLPEAYFFMNEESGHWPNLECPQWVLSKMKEFIFKTNPNSTAKLFQKSL